MSQFSFLSPTRRPRPLFTLGVALSASALVLGACGGGSPQEVEAAGPSLGSTATLPADAGPGWAATTTQPANAQRGASAGAGASAQPAVAGSPGAVLLRAAQDTRLIESFRFDMAISVTGMSDLPADVGSLDITVSGAQAANGDSQMILDMSQMGELLREAVEEDSGALGDEQGMAGMVDMFVGMFAEPMEIRAVGDKTYMKMGGMLSMLGLESDKDWIAGDANESGMGDDVGEMVPFIDAENPASILAAINGSGEVEMLGTEEIDGVTSTHYRGMLDPNAADTATTPEERASIEEALSGLDFDDLSGDPVPTDVWIGDDGFVRRLRFSLDESNMDPAADATDGDFEAMTIDMRFSDLGENVVIDVPPASEITTEEELSEGFGFGGMTFDEGT